MLKIWGRNNSINVQKVLWAADECGVAWEREDVGGAFGKNDQPWYRAMNPNGLVPTAKDGDLVLWESNSIVRYLGAKYGPPGFYPADPGERALAERWMDWQLSAVGASMTTLFWGYVRTPPEKRDPAALAAALKSGSEIWARLDTWLADNEYVAGGRFTVGDIPAGAMAYRWHALPIERPDLPNLKRWYERLGERPSYRKHVMVTMT